MTTPSTPNSTESPKDVVTTNPKHDFWNQFVQDTSRLQKIFDAALPCQRRLLDYYPEESSPDDPDKNDLTSTELAHQKQAQIVQLQREITQYQSQNQTLEATHQSLREQYTSLEGRFERTKQALQIAGQSSRQAQKEAQDSREQLQALQKTVQTFQLTLEQTKNQARSLQEDHTKVQEAASSLEHKMIQKEADCAHLKKDYLKIKREYQALQDSYQQEKEQVRNFQQMQVLHSQTVQRLEREITEHKNLEQARKKRHQQLEADYNHIQLLLTQATENSNSETQNKLQETIQTLQENNANMHEQLQNWQLDALKQKEHLHGELTKAESVAQKYKIKLETLEEEKSNLLTNNRSLQKQIQDLKQSQRTTEIMTTTVKNHHHPEGQAVVPKPFQLPSLQQSSNECCICHKRGIGLMKKCACGKQDCPYRAHIKCAASVNIQKDNHESSSSSSGNISDSRPIILCEKSD